MVQMLLRGSGSRGLRARIWLSKRGVTHFILFTTPVSSCYEMRKESLVLSTSWSDHSLAYSDGVKSSCFERELIRIAFSCF